MRSWRSTLFGVGGAVFYLGYKIYRHEPLDINDFFLAAGLAGVGTMAKDAAVHSTANEVGEASAREKDKLLNP